MTLESQLRTPQRTEHTARRHPDGTATKGSRLPPWGSQMPNTRRISSETSGVCSRSSEVGAMPHRYGPATQATLGTASPPCRAHSRGPKQRTNPWMDHIQQSAPPTHRTIEVYGELSPPTSRDQACRHRGHPRTTPWDSRPWPSHPGRASPTPRPDGNGWHPPHFRKNRCADSTALTAFAAPAPSSTPHSLKRRDLAHPSQSRPMAFPADPECCPRSDTRTH